MLFSSDQLILREIVWALWATEKDHKLATGTGGHRHTWQPRVSSASKKKKVQTDRLRDRVAHRWAEEREETLTSFPTFSCSAGSSRCSHVFILSSTVWIYRGSVDFSCIPLIHLQKQNTFSDQQNASEHNLPRNLHIVSRQHCFTDPRTAVGKKKHCTTCRQSNTSKTKATTPLVQPYCICNRCMTPMCWWTTWFVEGQCENFKKQDVKKFKLAVARAHRWTSDWLTCVLLLFYTEQKANPMIPPAEIMWKNVCFKLQETDSCSSC